MIKFTEEDAPNPELDKFKVQVEKVARDYAKRHRWCEVVDTALAEMGIAGSNKIEVELLAPIKIDFNFDVEKLRGKSDDEQREILAKYIDSNISAVGMTFNLGANGLANLKKGVQIVDAARAEAKQRAQGIPPGFMVRFTSEKGRVGHLVRIGDRGSSGLCGTWARRETSPVDEGRVCTNCMKAVGIR